MMHYAKGKNVEEKLVKTNVPFRDCMPSGDFLWMHVNGGTKVENVVNYAKNALDNGEYSTMVWSGSGGGVVKTISSVEILKRSYPLYQVTRMCYVNVEEHWYPLREDLDEIVATRQIPALHILLSLTPLDESINGLQKPNTQSEFWQDPTSNGRKHQQNSRKEQQHSEHEQQENSKKTSNTKKRRSRRRNTRGDGGNGGDAAQQPNGEEALENQATNNNGENINGNENSQS